MNYFTLFDSDTTLQNGWTDRTGLIITCQKNTTGAPATTANLFYEGCYVANIISGVIYVNTGSSASPTWTALASGGSGITALTGDVTATGPGSAAATIAAGAVTTSKIANNAVDGTKIAIGSQATGSIMYYNGTDWVVLPIGTTGQVLTVAGGLPSWA